MQVSVIITAYNNGQFIENALKSVLAQTIKPAEIVLVDDGSKDNTHEIIVPYLDHIHYIYQENQERAIARNVGAQKTTGDYLLFLDGDDALAPEAIQSQLETAAKHREAGMIVAGYETMTKEGVGIKKYMAWEEIAEINLSAVVQYWPMILHSVLIRREEFQKAEGFRNQHIPVEDLDLWFRLGLDGCKMVWNQQVIARYRWHGNNSSMSLQRHRRALFQLLDDFFADARVPAEIQKLKTQTLVQKRLDCAARGYLVNDTNTAKQDLATAIDLEPTLKTVHKDWLLNVFVFWGRTQWAAGGQTEFVKTVCENLPANAPSKQEMQHSLKAAFAAADLFESADLNALKASKVWWEAIRNNPRYLKNRGMTKQMLKRVLFSRAAGFSNLQQ